jgi:tripartite-type tricarboxylate transporter receptor subunit TctC
MKRHSRLRIRQTLITLAGACLAAVSAGTAAQTYPSKPITLVSPFAAGGTSDVVARAVARAMEADLGQPVLVVNKAGAGGTLGIGAVAAAPADGHTLVMGGLGSVVFPSVVYKGRIKYDAAKDLVPVGAAAVAPTAIAVRSSLAATTFNELIAAAKREPNKLSFGSAGVGGTLHVAGVLLEKEAQISLDHIPYKGGAPAMTDLAGGNVDIALTDLTLLKPMLSSGPHSGAGHCQRRTQPLVAKRAHHHRAGLPRCASGHLVCLVCPSGHPRRSAECAACISGKTTGQPRLPHHAVQPRACHP